MNDVVPAAILVAALLAAVYVVRSRNAQHARKAAAPPPATSPGTLSLGQYLVQPGAQWLVLQPGQH